LLAFRHEAFPADLQTRIHRLAAGRLPAGDVLRELAGLDVGLGKRFASAAVAVAKQAGMAVEQLDGIASHGQTVAHHPEARASLQLGDPSVIAECTRCTTVADFRARDLAAGGEGAPLAPFFHWAVFSEPGEGRVALNLGGIANLTWIPRGARREEVLGFDVGPANVLMDAVVNALTQGRERMDRDGLRARRGRVDRALVERLLDDEFLQRPPPKSTGRERYGLAEAESLWDAWRKQGRNPDDLVATLVAFTAQAVARACRDFLPAGAPDRLLVGGGGAENPALVEALENALPGVPLEPFDVAGVPGRAAEAMAFSLMGRNALLGLSNHLPRCTGASRALVLGEIVPGSPGNSRRSAR
jgi:anhydro-N-acetylmuramic acid kinase